MYCTYVHTHTHNTVATLNAVRWQKSEAPPVYSARRIRRKIPKGCSIRMLRDSWMMCYINIQYATVRLATTLQAVHKHAPAITRFLQLFFWYVVIKSLTVVLNSHVRKNTDKEPAVLWCLSKPQAFTFAELNSIWCRELSVAGCHDTAMTVIGWRQVIPTVKPVFGLDLLSKCLTVSVSNGICFERLYLTHWKGLSVAVAVLFTNCKAVVM